MKEFFALFFLSLQQQLSSIVDSTSWFRFLFHLFVSFLVNAHKSHSRGRGTKAYIKNKKPHETDRKLEYIVLLILGLISASTMHNSCAEKHVWKLGESSWWSLVLAWSRSASPSSVSVQSTRLACCRVLPLVCATVAYNHLFCVCVCVFSAVTCGVSLCLGFVSNSSPTIHLSWALATTDKCCLLVLYNPQGIILNLTWQP